jgi:hypothetical protein
MDFPSAPTVGQAFGNYTWDGEKWVMSQPSSGAVRYDIAQTLTSDVLPATKGQRTQARNNIAAAPLDTLAFSGMQINGSMEINQETGTATVTANVARVCDGWLQYRSGGSWGTLNSVRMGLQPTELPGFSFALRCWVGTAGGVTAATDEFLIQHSIEGYRVARLAWGTPAAKPLTFACWMRVKRPGTYSGSIRNGNLTRAYTFSFTAAANTWQYKVFTIPGDTLGTWSKENQTGLNIIFCIAAGSTTSAPANAWTAGSYIGVTGTENMFSSNDDFLDITGLIVLPGIEAPSAENSALIMRPAGEESLICYRYLQFNRARLGGFCNGAVAVGGAAAITFQHQPIVPYRVYPTVSLMATTFDFESPPWNAAGQISNAVVGSNGHIEPTGGDLMISGTVNLIPLTTHAPATLTYANMIKFDARL